jgi:hypothetical protein
VSAPFERYPFVHLDPAQGEASLAAVLPLTLAARASVQVSGLLDTAAAVSVLPYDVGLRLGLDWAAQTIPLKLTGNLAQVEARAVLLTATVGAFPPVRLAFAWSRSNDVPLLLGRVNFFAEFDVCFFRSRAVFEVRPKATS